MDKKLSKSHALGSKAIYEACKVLQENNGQLPIRSILSEMEKRIDLDNWAKEKYEKSGLTRWKSIFHFFSIFTTKAGFILKKEGIWYLTKEGEEALKRGEKQFHELAKDGFKKWKKSSVSEKKPEKDPDDEEESSLTATIEQTQQLAKEKIEEYIQSKNPYEFQDLVAALLRGMGYHTPFVAPKGRDGGVDVIAYRDPLGTTIPRIKVQVKHREKPSGPDEMRQLSGIMKKEGDVGIFVSTGGFTPSAKEAARSAPVHMELIDLGRFITLWQKFYEKLNDEDKSLLPLFPIYFVEPDD